VIAVRPAERLVLVVEARRPHERAVAETQSRPGSSALNSPSFIPGNI
jgi:hypothetical protein